MMTTYHSAIQPNPSIIPSVFILLLVTFSGFIACEPATVEENPFWNHGEPVFDTTQIFDDQRFPDITTATDGTLIATWGGVSPNYGTGKLIVRRSEDGGESWSDPIVVADGVHWNGGGTTVDENTERIFAFAERPPMTVEHPAGELLVFRSSDHGQTWQEHEISIEPNSLGHIPSMHTNESGMTLQFGEYAGRLIRPTRFYGAGNEREHWEDHYTNAMYSDDGGDTWQTSEPFPAMGTGEAAIAELSDGRIYYNSRRHLSTDGLNPRMRHIAWSYDGGHSWEDLSVSDRLPDGSQHRDYGLMAGLVRLPLEEHDILIFSNIDSDEGREHGTVWVSFDGGETWPVHRLVDEGGFAYSSLAAGRPGEGFIYLLYEDAGHPDSAGIVARFNLAWLTEGRDWREYLPESSD